MSGATVQKTKRATQGGAALRVSRYDQVAGILLATLLVMGTITALMALILFADRLFWVTPAVPVTVLEDVGGGGSGQVLGSEQQFEEPSPAEAPQVGVQMPVEQEVLSVASIVAAKAPDFD